MCWTGWACSSSQICSYMATRASRSSPATRTLIRPWESRLAEISFMTDSVRPDSPIITTGLSPWASARSSLRSAGVSFCIVFLLNLQINLLKAVFYANEEEKIKQELVARPYQRPLRQAGAEGRVPGPCRLQAQGNRRKRKAHQGWPGHRRPGQHPRQLEPVRAPQAGGQGRGRHQWHHDRPRHAADGADQIGRAHV